MDVCGKLHALAASYLQGKCPHDTQQLALDPRLAKRKSSSRNQIPVILFIVGHIINGVTRLIV
jgi:hypothetical protein